MHDVQAEKIRASDEVHRPVEQSSEWQAWLQAELSPRAGEAGDQSYKRMVSAISAVLDSDQSGQAAGAVEAVIASLYDGAKEMRHNAFREACSGVFGWLGKHRVKAGLIMAPVIMRGSRKSDLARQIDPITCATIQREANDRIRAAGFHLARIVPISAIVTPEETQEAPVTMYYRLLRAAMEGSGVKVGRLLPDEASFSPSVGGPVAAFDQEPMSLQWGQLPEITDTGAFIEVVGPLSPNPQIEKPHQRWAAPRMLLFVWIGRDDECADCAKALDKSPGWRQWLAQILESYRLDQDHVEMLQMINHPLAAYMVEGQGVSPQEAQTQSVSILGLDVPVAAMQTLARRCSLIRAIQALQPKVFETDMDVSPVGSITYSPSRDVLSIRLDESSDEPDLMIGTVHSAWLYPFIAELREAMLSFGCGDVKTKILDKTIQPKGSEGSFRAIH